MAVRSRPFVFSGSLPPSAVTDVYTVPAGRTAVVRHFAVTNRAAVVRTIRLLVRSAAGTSVDVARGVVDQNGTVQVVPCHIVLGPGDMLSVATDAGGGSTALSTYAGGSLLLGAPE